MKIKDKLLYEEGNKINTKLTQKKNYLVTMSQKDEDIEALNEEDKLDERNLKQIIKDSLLTLNKLNEETTQEQKMIKIRNMRRSTQNFLKKSSVFHSATTFKSMNTINFKIDEVDDKFNNDIDSNWDRSDDENLNNDILHMKKRDSFNSKNNTMDFYCKNIDNDFKEKYGLEIDENQEDLN
jgi:hypothetical protein